MQDCRHKNTSTFLPSYHFVWIPRRRRSVLVGEVVKRLDTRLREKAQKLACEVLALEIMPEHLHRYLEEQTKQD